MDAASSQELMQAYLEQTGPVLCLDIGCGTQDVVLAMPGETVENWPKFVLPSPARQIGRRLRELGEAGKSVWLTGTDMGGGFSGAMRELLAKGLRVAATKKAACAIAYDPVRVANLGVEAADTCPKGFVPVTLGDYDARAWEAILAGLGLPAPNEVLVCAQDHGEADMAKESRHARVRHFSAKLADNPDPAAWVEDNPPRNFARLAAIHEATGGMVADSGPAVLAGCLLDDAMNKRSFREGVTFVNVGNGHVFSALLYRGLVRGIYEHHVKGLSRERLLAHLDEFRKGFLSADVVMRDGGHGTIYGPECPEAGDYAPTFVCGPNRGLVAGCGIPLAPFGAMMHAGCFGLLFARARAHLAQGSL